MTEFLDLDQLQALATPAPDGAPEVQRPGLEMRWSMDPATRRLVAEWVPVAD